MLTPMQRDALTEIMNIHLCESASQLSDMVSQKIILSVPELKLQTGNTLDPSLLNKYGITGEEDVTLTTLKFEGEFNGKATIVFPKHNANVLVNACLGRDLSEDTGLYGMDIDVIREISNIILNSLVGEFGNILDVKLDYTSLDTGFSLSSLKNGESGTEVLVLFISFFLTESQIKGIIMIALSPNSFKMLTEKIDDMISENDV